MQQISACFIFRRLSHLPDKEFVMLKNQQLWNKGQKVLCVQVKQGLEMKDPVAYQVVILRISPLDKLGRFEPTAEFFFCLHCFNQLRERADPKYYQLVC